MQLLNIQFPELQFAPDTPQLGVLLIEDGLQTVQFGGKYFFRLVETLHTQLVGRTRQDSQADWTSYPIMRRDVIRPVKFSSSEVNGPNDSPKEKRKGKEP